MAEDVVQHPRYGRGIIKDRRHRGQELYVAFDDGHRRWVSATQVQQPTRRPERSSTVPTGLQSRTVAGPARRLSPVEPPASAKRAQYEEYPQAVVPAGSEVAVASSAHALDDALPAPTAFESRRIVEAFRMGIVPDDCIASMTVGRDRELDGLLCWLAGGSGSALVVGEYGSGKSHLLRYLYLRAMQSGYAVALVRLEPNETPLYKPKRVYRDVVLSLEYRSPGADQPRGFRQLVRDALSSGGLGDHRYLRVLQDGYAMEPTYSDLVWEWLEARQNDSRPVDWVSDMAGCRYNRFSYVPPIYDHTTASNIICYLLSGLSWASRCLGLRGLLLLFDEAESMSMSASAMQIGRAHNFLTGLVRVTDDDERLLDHPVQSGLTYSGMGIGQEIPFLYRRGCGLRAVFGLTPSPELETVPALSSAYQVNLQPLSQEALETLYGWIQARYGSAYGLQYTDADRKALLELTLLLQDVVGHTRSFTKASIEILDLLRHKRQCAGLGDA